MNYTDPYTLDGKLKYQPWVSESKVKWTQELVEKMMTGDRQAKGLFESLITTSELSLNLAHLVNAQVLPQLETAELVSDQIAGTRQVDSFRENYLYTAQTQVESGVKGKSGNSPVDTLARVPEATPYSEIKFGGELIEGSGIGKYGASIGITWEALRNDAIGVVAQLPGLFRQLGENTLEDVVFDAATNTSGIVSATGGTIVTGQTVVANSALTREALIAAIAQLKKSVFDNYKERLRGGFNLLVAVGQKEAAEFVVNNVLLTGIDTPNGNDTLRNTVVNYNPLSGINVVESGYVTGTEWFLLPAKGSTVRPVVDRLSLVGHPPIELRVENAGGQYVGGGNVSPLEGNFNLDIARWRARVVTGGVLWSPKAVLKSTGAGS